MFIPTHGMLFRQATTESLILQTSQSGRLKPRSHRPTRLNSTKLFCWVELSRVGRCDRGLKQHWRLWVEQKVRWIWVQWRLWLKQKRQTCRLSCRLQQNNITDAQTTAPHEQRCLAPAYVVKIDIERCRHGLVNDCVVKRQHRTTNAQRRSQQVHKPRCAVDTGCSWTGLRCIVST